MDSILKRTGKYLNQLSMYELLQEYTSCNKEATEKTLVYISVPEDSSNRPILVKEVEYLMDMCGTYAVEIADRLTR